MEEKRKYKVVKVKEDVHRQIKVIAVQQSIKLEDVVDTVLSKWLKTQK